MQNGIAMMAEAKAPVIGLQHAVITGRADRWYFLGGAAAVRGGPDGGRALRAESCLIEPASGDTVLVAAGVPGPAYILSILARADAAQSRLSLPGGVALCTEKGKLTVSAEQVALAARDGISLQAPQVSVAAIACTAHFHHLSASADRLDSRVGVFTMLAQSVHTSVGKLVQKAKNSFRWTEHLDETRAGRLRQQVAGRYSLNAEHASVIAEGHVKVDGQKIDLG